MLKPTQDSELKQSMRMAIYANITPISGIGGEQLIQTIDRIIDRITNDLETRGYHVGLPPIFGKP